MAAEQLGSQRHEFTPVYISLPQIPFRHFTKFPSGPIAFTISTVQNTVPSHLSNAVPKHQNTATDSI